MANLDKGDAAGSVGKSCKRSEKKLQHSCRLLEGNMLETRWGKLRKAWGIPVNITEFLQITLTSSLMGALLHSLVSPRVYLGVLRVHAPSFKIPHCGADVHRFPPRLQFGPHVLLLPAPAVAETIRQSGILESKETLHRKSLVYPRNSNVEAREVLNASINIVR